MPSITPAQEAFCFSDLSRWTFPSIVLLGSIVGCGPEANTPLHLPPEEGAVVQKNDRFEIHRVGVFEDDLAYGDKRGIYVIKDTKNQTEYVGISGVGIAEVGSHTTHSGKTTIVHRDER